MTSSDYWKIFKNSGRVSDYLNYKRAEGDDGVLEELYEARDQRFGDMGDKDGGGGQGHYDFDG